jgi:cytochrome c553
MLEACINFLEKLMIFVHRLKHCLTDCVARPIVRRIAITAAASLMLFHVASASAADVDAGKAKAGMCSTCHGPLGLSQLPNAPHLAGQPAIYTSEQLKQYRNGKRSNAVMEVLAKPLTDKEIEDLSAWYESIKITVQEK